MFGNAFGQSVPGEKRTGTLFGSTTAPTGGLFGNLPQQQQQQPQQQSTAQPASSLFGTTAPSQNNSMFGASQQQQQQQQQQQNAAPAGFGASQLQAPQQQQPLNNSIFGGLVQPAPTLSSSFLQQQKDGLHPLRQSKDSAFPSASISGREKSIPQQMLELYSSWDPLNPDTKFSTYFYNHVRKEEAPFYGPQPHEDVKKWEEALKKKPSENAIPVLARGFQEIAARIRYQELAVNSLQTRLHEINNSLSLMKDMHELELASRITEAKRKHVVFTQRILTLATKVQLLRNRGYAMDHAEEELKKKLTELEKRTFDPVLGGRQEELWARMSGVREKARQIEAETERLGKAVEAQNSGEILSDEEQKQVERLLKDYDRQLESLKKWVDDTKVEYDEWEKERNPAKTPVSVAAGR